MGVIAIHLHHVQEQGSPTSKIEIGDLPIAQITTVIFKLRHPSAPVELRGKVGDGVNQAAGLISATVSIPSLNFIPLTTFGNWF
jgi:hypothetical protein